MALDINDYPLLAKANLPEQLRQLPQDKLPALSNELRSYLLQSVSQSSGHFASGLGTVELTVALHYVYNTPFDRLIWDVGHQAYPHKILTGRRARMGAIGQKRAPIERQPQEHLRPPCEPFGKGINCHQNQRGHAQTNGQRVVGKQNKRRQRRLNAHPCQGRAQANLP